MHNFFIIIIAYFKIDASSFKVQPLWRNILTANGVLITNQPHSSLLLTYEKRIGNPQSIFAKLYIAFFSCHFIISRR